MELPHLACVSRTELNFKERGSPKQVLNGVSKSI